MGEPEQREAVLARDDQHVATARVSRDGDAAWVRLTIERMGAAPLDVEVPREWLERAAKVGA